MRTTLPYWPRVARGWYHTKRIAANVGAGVVALAGLASLCALVLMLGGWAGYQMQRHPERPGVAWIKR